jgi:hypothetical protein
MTALLIAAGMIALVVVLVLGFWLALGILLKDGT